MPKGELKNKFPRYSQNVEKMRTLLTKSSLLVCRSKRRQSYIQAHLHIQTQTHLTHFVCRSKRRQSYIQAHLQIQTHLTHFVCRSKRRQSYIQTHFNVKSTFNRNRKDFEIN